VKRTLAYSAIHSYQGLMIVSRKGLIERQHASAHVVDIFPFC